MKVYRGDGDVVKMVNVYNPNDIENPNAYEWVKLTDVKVNRFDALVRQGDSSADVLLAEKIKNRIIERIPKDGLNIDQIRMLNRIVGIVEGFINNGVLDSK